MIKNLDRRAKVRALSAIQDLLEDSSPNSVLNLIAQGSGELVSEIIRDALNKAQEEILGESTVKGEVLERVGAKLTEIENSKVLSLLESLAKKMASQPASEPKTTEAAPASTGTPPISEQEKAELIARRFPSRGRETSFF
jgi:Arc/MetJ-type ribon-helix-helix transcriptional regulator